MKWRTIIWRRLHLQGISTAVFLMLVILLVTLTGCESLEDSKGSAKTEEKPSPSSSSKEDSSPALNSFLENVLKAQDELKWIDQAVRRVGTKEMSENAGNRYMRNPEASRRFHSNIRSKRKSDEEESWPSFNRGYYDEEDDPRINFDEDYEFGEATRNHQRLSLIDDSTLTHWAESEGLEVPGGWLDSVENAEDHEEEDGWSDSEGDADDWFERLRDGRDAPADSSEAEEPSLESLKRTVSELRKSLEDSDKQMDTLTEKQGDPGVAKNRERQVEASKNSNWRNDPRSAVDMFDFKRREDDLLDDEDDDEDSEPGISEFDYMMHRVKREDENGGVSDPEERREIREARIDDIKTDGNVLGGPGEKIKTQDKGKNEADDDPTGKPRAVGDEIGSPLNERKQNLSPENVIKSKLEELLKPQEKAGEVEKSEANDDGDVRKVTRDSDFERLEESGKSLSEAKNSSNASSAEDKGEKLSEGPSKEERKYNKQEEGYEQDKIKRDGTESAELGKALGSQKSDEASTAIRKLLWLSDKSDKGVEIRDGRRDSAWDQNRGEKSGQRPANYLGGLEESKFTKRSLMVANDKQTLQRKESRSEYLDPEDDSEVVEKRSMAGTKEGDVDEEAYEDDGDDKLQGDSDGDRDPMRDRINMLIKQKLDDRGKGKLVRLKREVHNIQYYDYDSNVNAAEPEPDSTAVQNDKRRGCEANATYPQIAVDKAPPELTKKDYQGEEEMKEKLEQEKLKNKEPKQEFISDIELAKAQKKKQPSSKEIEEDEKKEALQREDAKKEVPQHEEEDSGWLEQPEEAEGDSKDSGNDQESRDPEEVNDGGEILGEPLEYSVNVHGKLDPESISNILEKGTGTDAKDKGMEEEEEEEEEEKVQMVNDEDWKYDGTEGGSRSRDQEVDRDLEPSDQRWRAREEPVRIGEENKGGKYDFQKIYESENARYSREARDSLPTMLDRSSVPRELIPGERTYLVIAPNELRHPTGKESLQNSSSSRSNYMALKVTDDLFKGGIEQSNPPDDKMETNPIGRTTTEWKVIKPQDDSSSDYDDDPRGQDIAMNPRDVARESFVDREEILGDFDDDARPRFRRDLKYVQESFDHHSGRILQSVSDPVDIADPKMDFKAEKPVKKYLENARSDFENSETTVFRRVKRNDDPINLVKDEVGDKNSTTTVKIEQVEMKNTTETPNDKDNDNVEKNQVDKSKRGSTNVEEWEMDAPTVQKQEFKKNVDFEKEKDSHERETRSLKSDSDRKNREKLKPRDNYQSSNSHANQFAKYVRYGSSRAKKSDGRRYWRANREHRKNSRGGRPKNHRFRHNGAKHKGRKKSGSKKSPKRRSKNAKRHRSAVTRHAKTMTDTIGKKSFRDAIDEKKIEEEGGDKTHSKRPGTEEGQKKKFTVLLAADNMEDESQMGLALHGELAGKIVERIYDQVQKNDALKVSLGPGLFRKHKSEDAVATDKIYREGLDEDEVKHTEGMMRRVMELLGRLVVDEVQRKTCASLPPDMREFLQWMLGVDSDNRPTDQTPEMFGNSRDANQTLDDNFLFDDPSTNNEIANLSELNKKVKVLKKLIDQYSSLSSKEKTKVQTVHNYLVRQLGLLDRYIEAKQNEGSTTQTPSTTGNTSQYQNEVLNSTGTTFYQSTMSPLVGTPSILMLSNASFIEHPANEPSSHLFRPGSGHRDVRSSEVSERRKRRKHKKHKHPHSKKHRKHKRHERKKKNKKKHRRHHRKRKSQSPEYRKLIRSAAMMRKKRANNLYEDDWNPMDSGYEEPTIYTSSGQLTNKNRRSVSEKDHKLANDEVALLTKREAWKSENEQQLEEVAFGKDMRGKWKEKEEFEKLTEMDKRKNDDGENRKKREEDAEEAVKTSVPENLKASVSPMTKENEKKSGVDETEEQKKRSVGSGSIKPDPVSTVLPLPGLSDARQEEKGASKTEKDDQRDVADQILGLESPIIAGLNTY